jgi:hypothetical protein
MTYFDQKYLAPPPKKYIMPSVKNCEKGLTPLTFTTGIAKIDEMFKKFG